MLFIARPTTIRVLNSPAQSRSHRVAARNKLQTNRHHITQRQRLRESMASGNSQINELKQLLRELPHQIAKPCESQTFTKEEEAIAKYVSPGIVASMTEEVEALLESDNFQYLEEGALRLEAKAVSNEDEKLGKINLQTYRKQALACRINLLKRKLAIGDAQIHKLMVKVDERRNAVKEIEAAALDDI